MKKLYVFFCLGFWISHSLIAQETITFPAYNGSGSTLSVVATSTVNETITIVFEDSDIIQNFYTQFQNSIFMYGGLDTNAGGFQGTPDFNDLLSQPEFLLIDADNNAQPNTYSLTINLAQHYTAVANGTMVYGCNLLFQNQFGGGGNNQTLDLYIDLADAPKDDTLGLDSLPMADTVRFVNNELLMDGLQTPAEVTVYDLTGRRVTSVITSSERTPIHLPAHHYYVMTIVTDGFSKTLKIVSL